MGRGRTHVGQVNEKGENAGEHKEHTEAEGSLVLLRIDVVV
jgi:hypothetical protein|eukprot:COSAG01_NODE_23962_length_795_cov_1.547414_2_plen_41_part_00